MKFEISKQEIVSRVEYALSDNEYPGFSIVLDKDGDVGVYDFNYTLQPYDVDTILQFDEHDVQEYVQDGKVDWEDFFDWVEDCLMYFPEDIYLYQNDKRLEAYNEAFGADSYEFVLV